MVLQTTEMKADLPWNKFCRKKTDFLHQWSTEWHRIY